VAVFETAFRDVAFFADVFLRAAVLRVAVLPGVFFDGFRRVIFLLTSARFLPLAVVYPVGRFAIRTDRSQFSRVASSVS
jgi:hypothetical protein